MSIILWLKVVDQTAVTDIKYIRISFTIIYMNDSLRFVMFFLFGLVDLNLHLPTNTLEQFNVFNLKRSFNVRHSDIESMTGVSAKLNFNLNQVLIFCATFIIM